MARRNPISRSRSAPPVEGGRLIRSEHIGMRLTVEELLNIPIFGFYSLSGQFSFPVSQSIVLRLFFPCFWAWTILLFAANRAKIAWSLWTCRFAFLFLMYDVISLAWNDSRTSYAYVVAVTAACTFLYYNYLIQRFPLNSVVRILVWTLSAELIMSVIVILILRRFGIDDGSQDPNNRGAWRGIFIQKNNLGAASAFAIAVALGLRPRTTSDRFWKSLLFILGILCVGGSQSRESWIAVILVIISSLFVRVLRETAPASRLPIILVALPLISIIALAVYYNLDDILQLLHRTRSASGRTEIWDASILLFKRRPWFGYGLAGIWGTPHAWDVQARVGWSVTSSHNNYLEVLLTFGIVGFLLYLPLIGSSLLYMSRALLSYDLRELQVLIYGMIVIFVISMAIAYIMYSPSLGFVLLIYFVSHLENIERSGFMRLERSS
jgi:exopolysaccharide production protein ExoQ